MKRLILVLAMTVTISGCAGMYRPSSCYTDYPESAQHIQKGVIAEGMKVGAMICAWGQPQGITSSSYNSIKTYQYYSLSAPQFVSLVQVRNGVIVGWIQNGR